MKAQIGTKIRLTTHQGDFDAVHVVVSDESGVAREGVALQNIICNDKRAEPCFVRLQSSCLFSESFWATDCDCALQLQSALTLIAKHGGLVLYFYEEGRGAGLATKFKAIELQQLQGLNTRQAYECLSISADGRTYEAAAVALKALLKNEPIILLTNNNEKMIGLQRHGINVHSRQSLVCGSDQPQIRNYLNEKRNALNHDIPKFE